MGLVVQLNPLLFNSSSVSGITVTNATDKKIADHKMDVLKSINEEVMSCTTQVNPETITIALALYLFAQSHASLLRMERGVRKPYQ